MQVHIVYIEYQANTPEIVGIYTDKEFADRVADGKRRELANDGEAIEDYNDEDDELDWTVSVHVEAHDLNFPIAIIDPKELL